MSNDFGLSSMWSESDLIGDETGNKPSKYKVIECRLCKLWNGDYIQVCSEELTSEILKSQQQNAELLDRIKQLEIIACRVDPFVMKLAKRLNIDEGAYGLDIDQDDPDSTTQVILRGVDELLARVEQLEMALGNCIEHAICNDVMTDRFAEMLTEALSEPPQQSLAKHDKHVKVEAIREAAQKVFKVDHGEFVYWFSAASCKDLLNEYANSLEQGGE